MALGPRFEIPEYPALAPSLYVNFYPPEHGFHSGHSEMGIIGLPGAITGAVLMLCDALPEDAGGAWRGRSPLLFINGNETTIPYTQIDNPTGPGTVFTGTWFASTAEGSEDDFVQITLSAASTFRLGILVDNHDFADISPSSLRVRQTVGGTANSGLQTSNLQPNVNDDWYFFDISGNAGDQFTVSGVNWYCIRQRADEVSDERETADTS